MKIFYDHQAFSRQVYGGVSKYFYHLLSSLGRMDGDQAFLSQRFSNNAYLENEPAWKFKSFLKNCPVRGRYRVMNYLNKKFTIRKLKTLDYSVFHPTYYDPYFLDHIGRKPFVLTIFDMIHEKFLKNTRDKTLVHKKVLATRAVKIIAISRTTKKDITEVMGITPEKIEVIYLGGGLNKPGKVKSVNLNLPEKYVLFVGDRKGYKNFSRLLESIDVILLEDLNLCLLCMGGGDFDKRERSFLKKAGLRNKVFQISPQNYQIHTIYQNARALIYPSMYEGFGLPVLEAFSCGCPVALSNTPALTEVGGEAATYFNPLSEFSINEAVKQVLENTRLRADLINRGYEQVKKFSWQKMAEQTLKLYQSVL